ncbi:ATP-binding cassette domain-containing protein, partial [Pseudomonas sp. 2995-3]|uniref:ATP-binding cassette domain-containing protein n=1 Tax=Pseudomonas sp. 2995-3 TaxID=1712680 RepID=UPI0015B24419
FKEEILRVENLTKKGWFEDVSFSLRKGEILGFAGLIGAGRSELARVINGDVPPDEGKIYWKGEEVRFKKPLHAVAN